MYAGVQAARLGLQTRILGRARRSEVEPLLPDAPGITWALQEAPESTSFTNRPEGKERVQQVHGDAGRIALDDLPRARIVHLGPITDEIDASAACRQHDPEVFVGATPQGLFRTWGDDRVVHLRPVVVSEVVSDRLDAVVVGHNEEAVAQDLLDAVANAGGLVVVTHGLDGCVVRTGDRTREFPSAVVVPEVDGTGAGDVFAAALFVELARGVELPDAVRFAQGAAAASVRGVSVDAIADRAAIDALLAG